MDLGVYIREIANWHEIPGSIKQRLGWIICGDYGCSKILPAIPELDDFHHMLSEENIQLHYISPKVTEATIGNETERVKALLDKEIHVSVNDWGLLYRLRPFLKPEHSVYTGRLLSKSISDWAWASIFLAKEEQGAAGYLAQNNFQHRIKIDFLKQWGIRGMEAGILHESEPSLARIKAQGLEVIGYADHTILALSRACPLARLKGLSANQCGRFCRVSHQVIPSKDTQKEIYPKIELWGNLLCRPEIAKPQWNGYQKIIYRWTSDLESRLREDNIIEV